MKSTLLLFMLLLVLLSGCVTEFPPTEESSPTEPLQETIPPAVPAAEIVPLPEEEAAVTIDSLTCTTSLPPPDSGYCPNCHYYNIDWNGSTQGPVRTVIYPDTNLGYRQRTADCGEWTGNLNTNCLREEGQSFATTFAGGMDNVDVEKNFEFRLVMILNAPGVERMEVEKTVICS